MTAGVSRAGSQVIKMGRSWEEDADAGVEGVVDVDVEELGGPAVGEEVGEESEVEVPETRSIMRAILSSSSGQMSGQCVKPK